MMLFVDDLVALVTQYIWIEAGAWKGWSTTTPSTFVKSMTKGTTDTTAWPHTVNVRVHLV